LLQGTFFSEANPAFHSKLFSQNVFFKAFSRASFGRFEQASKNTFCFKRLSISIGAISVVGYQFSSRDFGSSSLSQSQFSVGVAVFKIVFRLFFFLAKQISILNTSVLRISKKSNYFNFSDFKNLCSKKAI
jgi:hypothetical protein